MVQRGSSTSTGICSTVTIIRDLSSCQAFRSMKARLPPKVYFTESEDFFFISLSLSLLFLFLKTFFPEIPLPENFLSLNSLTQSPLLLNFLLLKSLT